MLGFSELWSTGSKYAMEPHRVLQQHNSASYGVGMTARKHAFFSRQACVLIGICMLE